MRLLFGALSSKTAADIFAGANVFAVKADDGGWEVCQFRDATLREDGAWRLRGLLRGQAGSEPQALAGASIGARIVLLNASLSQAVFGANVRGLAFDWQAGPETDIPGTVNFTENTLTLSSRGLVPFAPVHLRARWKSDDIRLTWIRRTRLGGDSWEGEVPLSEAYERYRLTIFDGETPVRTVEASMPEYLYTAADIFGDFGTSDPGAAISFSVAQLSDAVGEGVMAGESVVIA